MFQKQLLITISCSFNFSILSISSIILGFEDSKLYSIFIIQNSKVLQNEVHYSIFKKQKTKSVCMIWGSCKVCDPFYFSDCFPSASKDFVSSNLTNVSGASSLFFSLLLLEANQNFVRQFLLQPIFCKAKKIIFPFFSSVKVERTFICSRELERIFISVQNAVQNHSILIGLLILNIVSVEI